MKKPISTITNEQAAIAYQKHKHLKNAADELGVGWQSLYVRLIKIGVSVTGDKKRYGSRSDMIGAKGESDFQVLVPAAKNQNEVQFQAPIDFEVYGYGVDVKASNRRNSGGKSKGQRWAFSIKKQESTCDFFVFMAYTEDQSKLEKTFLIPADICRFTQSISISTTGKSKWMDYEVQPSELKPFFEDLK